MFRKLDDFFQTYQELTRSTLNIFSQLTDGNLEQRILPDHRSLADIAWHIVVTVGEMMGRTGIRVTSIDLESMPPNSAGEIVRSYRLITDELKNKIQTNWNDDTLLIQDNMYGEEWARGLTLMILIHHEIHHRAQMTVLLRQSGGRVPGTMGPAKEEWSTFGMELPSY